MTVQKYLKIKRKICTEKTLCMMKVDVSVVKSALMRMMNLK